MFGDPKYFEDLSEELLEKFTLEEILELNDISEVEAVARLIELGLITVDDE